VRKALQANARPGVEPVDDQVDTDPPPVERRENQRHLTICRVAKLTSGDDESLCVARNISSGGMKIDVLAHFDVGQAVRVSLVDDQYLDSKIVWRRDYTIGIQFETEIDVMHALAKPPVKRNRYRRRMPRMPIRERAQLRVGLRALPVEICDISLHGVRIKTDHAFGEHEMVWVVVNGLDPICGTLRWWFDGHAGIEFANVIPINQLMEWLRE
jgi:hypothetical protein